MRPNLLLICALIGVTFVACGQPEVRKPVQKRSGGFMEGSVQRNKAMFAQESIEIENFIKSQDSIDTYQQSEGGFWYSIQTNLPGNSTQPKKGDTVIFRYAVYDLAMNPIVSVLDNGTIEYQVDQSHQELITGLREGIKLSTPKSELILVLPSIMAYGYRGLPGTLAPNTPVLVEIYRD